MNTKIKYNCEFEVEGMHCAACELLIESKLSKFDGVKEVDAVLSKNKVYLEINKDLNPKDIMPELSSLIEEHGYKLVEKSPRAKVNYKELILGGIIATLLISLFYIIQRSGLINISGNADVTLPFIFFIGFIASISTCMAVVGGLCISISSNYAKEHKAKPLIMFHLSRLISFFLFGGIIGIIGSAFVLTPFISFILSVIVFVVMIIMAINLLDIIPYVKNLQIKSPKLFGKKLLKIEENSNVFTPIILGAITFFLPCGFTQSMQIYSLTTGNFLTGAVTMLVFALGTFPVLALISFASVRLSKTIRSGLFFKTAGILVLFFAIFNLINALVTIGVIEPIFII